MMVVRILLSISLFCFGVTSYANWACDILEHDQVKSLTLTVGENAECLLYKEDGFLYGQPFSNLMIKNDSEGLEVSDGQGLLVMYLNFESADGYFSGLEQFLTIENCREKDD